MPDLASVIPDAPLVDASGDAPRRAQQRLGSRAGLGFWVPAVWIAVVAIAAICADLLPLKNPTRSDFSNIAVGPGTGGHLLGTDEIGRDILARLVFGARVSLTVGLVAVAVGMLIGGAIGLAAGYFRGRTETVLMGIVDIMLAFPALVLVIAVTAFLGQSLRNVTVAVAIVAVPAFARVTRSATLSCAHRDYVTAARAMGATHWRIIRREIIPNVVLPVAAFALVVVGVAIIAEGGLAFLGLSVPPPHPSWGSMIYGGKNKLADGTAPFISLIPAGVMFLTVLSFNLVGDRVRALFDTRGASL